jgi:dihydrofolate reductase
MGRIIVEQIVSADGFAQGSDGGMKFMTVAEPDEVDDDQLRMLERVDAIVFGRVTYGMFAEYWPGADPKRYPVAKPIAALPKHVVSNTLETAPWADGEIAVEGGDGVESVRRLREHYAGDLIIWGSLTLTDALFRAGEVDVLRLRIVPTLIGAGRGATPDDLPLTGVTLAGTRVFPGGQVTLEYALAR